MRAGRLRHRVQVQKAVETPDGLGNLSREWLNVGRVWASVEPISGREHMASQKVDADVTHRVRMRWSFELPTTHSHRLQFGRTARTLNITRVMNMAERNRELELLCTEDVT